MTLKPWYVISPEYGTVIPIMDDGTGPMEYNCDVVEVEAETQRDALLLGVKIMRGDASCHWHDDAECPYAGMKVESALCEHGGVTFEDACVECNRQWTAEAAEYAARLKLLGGKKKRSG